MEFGNGFYILLGVIILIGVIGITGNIQLASYYKALRNKLQDFERRNQLPSEEYSEGFLQDMIKEYSKFRSEGIEQINTQAMIEKNIFNQRMALIGMFRLPISTIERILAQLPSWAIILGLLGTFTGLTLALFDMQGTLLQLGSESGTEILTVSSIVGAISEPFKGMSFAFITSISGIGTAFLLNLLHSGLFSGLGIGPSYKQAKLLFFTECESLLDHQVQQLVQQSKPKDSLEKLLDRLVHKVQESFDKSVGRFGNEIITMTEKIDQSISGLEKVVERSYQFTEKFYQGTDQLTQFGEILQESIQQFQSHEKQVASRIEELSKQLQVLQHELKQLTQKNRDGQQAIAKVVERSDQIMKQSVRQNEEMYQHFHKQTEELQRRFQERFEEYQRSNNQQQDDWFHRYQEKNDQFSKAAESFGQAVQHLEREWNDGMERFKREVGQQWGHVLERYFSRQYNQQQDNKEMREIVRELEMLQHLLEREFQNMNRFSNEVSQILISMFDWGRSQMTGQQRNYDNGQNGRGYDQGRAPVVRERGY